MRLRKRQRLALVLTALVLTGSATGLVLAALQDKVAFFVSPSDLEARHVAPGRQLRLGGLVAQGSVKHDPQGMVRFALTDGAHSVEVSYHGILPDLFREGQGIVTEGRLETDGQFVASEVLAKHDERYMPKEVADALKKSGHWQPQTVDARP